MSARDPIDPFAVLTALGLSEQATLEPVRGGADAAIWRVDWGDERFALRVLRPDQAGQARVESAAMRAAAAGGLPVPAVVAAGAWRDHPALLLTWSPGRPLVEALTARATDAPRAQALGIAFGRAQAAIHAIPPPPELRDHRVPWEAWAGPDPHLRGCLARIPRRPPALLHLDCHPFNVLVENGAVTAVLDWANARPGDPRADLARTLSLLQSAPLPNGAAGARLRVRLHAFMTGWRDGYRKSTGWFAAPAPFCWWAGIVLERDLAPRLGRPDLPWLTPAYLARVRRWTTAWQARAGARSKR